VITSGYGLGGVTQSQCLKSAESGPFPTKDGTKAKAE